MTRPIFLNTQEAQPDGVQSTRGVSFKVRTTCGYALNCRIQHPGVILLKTIRHQTFRNEEAGG